MIKLGVNSVLFAGFDYETAARHIALAGYDGIEISAIKGMCEHLELDRWKEQSRDIREITARYGLELLAMEEAALDPVRLEKAFEAAAELGIPVVNVGPGGKFDVAGDLMKSIEVLAEMSEKALGYGIKLCVKAHVGAAIYNTDTTIKAMDAIASKGFGIDMDPSHIYRSGEDPEEALPKVLSRVAHIHIRDCVQRTGSPGDPQQQACGRGNIDLYAYLKALVESSYNGPLNLEVIGAAKLTLPEVSIIAAESYGYLNACLKLLGER